MNNRTLVSSSNTETNATQKGLTIAPRQIRQTFLDFDLALDLEHLEADIAILGLPYGDAYNIDEVTNDQTKARDRYPAGFTKNQRGPGAMGF